MEPKRGAQRGVFLRGKRRGGKEGEVKRRASELRHAWNRLEAKRFSFFFLCLLKIGRGEEKRVLEEIFRNMGPVGTWNGLHCVKGPFLYGSEFFFNIYMGLLLIF